MDRVNDVRTTKRDPRNTSELSQLKLLSSYFLLLARATFLT